MSDQSSNADSPERWSPQRAALMLVQAVEQERQRIGKILHDTVCQSFSGVRLFARVLERKCQPGAAAQAEDLRELNVLLRQSVGELYELTHRLEPIDLEEQELASALAILAERTAATVPCRLHEADEQHLPLEVALQFYRIAEEAVLNAVRHAGASEIVMALQAPSEREATLWVTDNGCGFQPSPPQDAPVQGLDLAHFRALAVGAHLVIDSQPGQGTTVTCRWASAPETL